MKLWISGETALGSNLNDFIKAFNNIENTINEVIVNRKYDLSLESWNCIAIIRDDDCFKERTRMCNNKTDMDFRLIIDYGTFCKASKAEMEVLIFAMLMRSLSILRTKGLNRKGLDDLEADVNAIGIQHGWWTST